MRGTAKRSIRTPEAPPNPSLAPTLELGPRGAVFDLDAQLAEAGAQRVGLLPVPGLPRLLPLPHEGHHVGGPLLASRLPPEQAEHLAEPEQGRRSTPGLGLKAFVGRPVDLASEVEQVAESLRAVEV